MRPSNAKRTPEEEKRHGNLLDRICEQGVTMTMRAAFEKKKASELERLLDKHDVKCRGWADKSYVARCLEVPALRKQVWDQMRPKMDSLVTEILKEHPEYTEVEVENTAVHSLMEATGDVVAEREFQQA